MWLVRLEIIISVQNSCYRRTMKKFPTKTLVDIEKIRVLVHRVSSLVLCFVLQKHIANLRRMYVYVLCFRVQF